MSGAIRLVTLRGECFEAELRSVDEYQERDGLLHKFYLTDMARKRGKRLVSVFISGTLKATCANYSSPVEIVRFNAIRRAFDQDALSFDGPVDERNYTELSLSPQDFQTQARTDAEIRQYIIHKAYWLAYRFQIHAQTEGIIYPIPFDEPADLDYMGATANDIWRIIRRLANQGLLGKILEGHARPTESLLSRYESGDNWGLGLTANVAAVAARETADRKFARLAIDEARKSVPEDGRVHPKVGVVVVKDGRVLASAHRGEIPECHAEYIALEKKLTDVLLSGATVYTTLEPCTARKHPKVPCAIRLTDRRVTRVVIGMLDPDKRIRGLGQMALRKARIATDFFQSELMDEVEELNRDFMRDRESYESNLPEALASRKDPPARAPTPPKLRVALVRGHVSNFLLKYTNDDDEELFIREARLFSGKIELTEPLTPDDPSLWKIPAHTSMSFGKTIVHQKNPAISFIQLNSNKGLSFHAEMDVVVSCEMKSQPFEIRQTLYVKVKATSNEIVPLV